MRIEAQFKQVPGAVAACPAVQAFDTAYDKRSMYEGFIRGEIYFIDGSILLLREFIDAEITPERLTYVQQYVDAAQHFVFRYDNTGQHRKPDLSTYPDHKQAAARGLPQLPLGHGCLTP